jgi:ABC-type transporter Mla subunit MlaD
MAPRLSWSSLVPGLVAVAVLIAVVAGVLMFAGVGRMRGETVRLYVVTSQARGVMRGTDVWLDGQKVGVVERIAFRAVGTDTLPRVVIAIDVRRDAAAQIRRDADIQIRSGTSLIGPMVVYVTSGTPASTRARPGDTLFARAQSDVADAATRLEEATREIDPLLADARIVKASVRNPNGTVGAALAGAARRDREIARLRDQVARLRATFGAGSGAGGAGGARAGLISATSAALARADSVRALLKSPQSSLGRFRRDSSLKASVAGVRDELAELRLRLADRTGTLGRLQSDSALSRAVADAQHEMTLLFEDLRKRPLRYIAF